MTYLIAEMRNKVTQEGTKSRRTKATLSVRQSLCLSKLVGIPALVVRLVARLAVESPRAAGAAGVTFAESAARKRAASVGFTTTRIRRNGTCPRRSGRAAPSSTTTTTAGWTYTSSTAAPSDFFTPEDAAQERALPQQPRRHFHRRDRQGRRRGRHVRHGRGRGRLRRRRLRRTSTSPTTAATSSIATTATGLSRT